MKMPHSLHHQTVSQQKAGIITFASGSMALALGHLALHEWTSEDFTLLMFWNKHSFWLASTNNWDLKCEWISLEIIFPCKGCCYLSELLLSFEILCYLGKFFRKWNIPIVGIFPYRIFSVINLTYYMLIFLNVHI